MPPAIKKKKNGFLRGCFSEVSVCSKKELAPFGTVFSVEPENYELRKLGALFGIIKISDTSQESSYVTNLLTSVIKKEYYSKKERLPAESFEAALRKANLALAEIARHGSVNWAGKINFAGGVLEKNNLHFSQLGKTYALLIRQGQIADIGEEMSQEKETGEFHPLKTFSNISSGKLEKNDKLIFTTDELLEIFSLSELRQSASAFSMEEFPELVRAALRTNADLSETIVIDLLDSSDARFQKDMSWGSGKDAALDKAEMIEEFTKERKRELSSDTPEEDLFPETEEQKVSEKTNHLYIKESEEHFPEKNRLGKLVIFAKNFGRKASRSAFSAKNKVFEASRKIRIPKIPFRKSKDSGMAFRLRPRQPTERENFESPGHFSRTLRKTRLLFSGLISGAKKTVTGRPWQKVAGLSVLLIALIVLVFFGFSKLFAKKPPLPEDTPPVAAEPTVRVLNDSQVKNVERVEEVAALPGESDSFSVLGDNLFFVSKNKSVFRIDPASSSVEETKSGLGSGNFKFLASMPHLNSLFIFTEDKKVVSFTPINKNFQENGIGLPSDANPAGIKTYLTYLYFFDPAANQIYRYPRAEGGFGERQDWLRSGADIKQAKYFSINDDLFTASDSEITAYLQGKKDEKIEFENPQTPLAIDKIYTAPDMENIYLLDNKNNRVVQYAKDGKIAAQYWNESIAGIKDFVVDEKNKVVYLLANNKLSRFPLE